LSGKVNHKKQEVDLKLFGLVLQKLGVADIPDVEDQEILMYNLVVCRCDRGS